AFFVSFDITLRFYNAHLTITTDPSPVTAQLGSDVVLKCDLTVDTPTPDLQYLIVKWFLNDKQLVEFNDKLIPSSFRVTMSEREIQNGNASLSIPKVTPADEGDYKCFVLYTLDKEEKTIRLKVEGNVAVSESLMNKDKVSVLTCEARGHYPKNITVEWRSGGQVQTGSILVTGENKDNTFNTINTYIFTSSEQDPGKTYSCHVCHISLKEPIQEDLILRLLGKRQIHMPLSLLYPLVVSDLVFTYLHVCLTTMMYSTVFFFPARPEVSDIKEVPLSTEDEVKFTVDVSKFYPEEIQIHWSLNGKQLKETTSEPHRNVDGTYSVTNQIVIPEGELKEKDQIKVIIEHKSMEKSAVKEKTLQD
uniref:Ig-like domain-containing protein n=1 Tax=Latimeria chalumnae TaxID=7897 RepID=H3AU83_LATCH